LNCLDEGALQSWLDGELAPEGIRSAAAHLDACEACSAALEGLRSRNAEVAAKFDLLMVDSLGPDRGVIYVSRRRWPAAAAAGALAASLVLAAGLHRAPVSAPVTTGQFLPLTDKPEPMQAGMLVRVTVPAGLVQYEGAPTATGMVQAEVIVGEDGRPRAVRFLPQ
jgi:hypothetical protein